MESDTLLEADYKTNRLFNLAASFTTLGKGEISLWSKTACQGNMFIDLCFHSFMHPIFGPQLGYDCLSCIYRSSGAII